MMQIERGPLNPLEFPLELLQMGFHLRELRPWHTKVKVSRVLRR